MGKSSYIWALAFCYLHVPLPDSTVLQQGSIIGLILVTKHPVLIFGNNTAVLYMLCTVVAMAYVRNATQRE
jgi:hypothetical protein